MKSLLQKYIDNTISEEERKQLFLSIESGERDNEWTAIIEEQSKQWKTGEEYNEARWKPVINQILHPEEKESKVVAMKSAAGVRSVNKWWWAAAAIVTLFITGTLFFLKGKSRTDSYRELVFTIKGEKKYYQLPDGTEVWLNSDSHLSASDDFGKDNRNIRLTGEAYFHVTKNAQLPFLINVKDVQVKVVGTSFNLRAYPDESNVETALVEGKVLLTTGEGKRQKTYNLIPGEKVTVKTFIQPAGNKINPSAPEGQTPEEAVITHIKYDGALPADALWKENKLSFDADPITIVASKMEKWYNKKVVIENGELKNLQFTGIFEATTINDLLEVLKKSGSIHNYRIDADTIYLK